MAKKLPAEQGMCGRGELGEQAVCGDVALGQDSTEASPFLGWGYKWESRGLEG